MCFDDEGRHHGGNEESSALWWAPNPSTPACKHKWHRSRRRSLRSSSRVPLPPPSPTPTLPAPPVLARPDETDETDVHERPVLARPLSDETDETDVLARPLSDETDETDVLERPLSDETDETDVLERPLSDETDETDVLERPLLALIGKGSGDDVAGRRRGRTCNRAQSRTIRLNQDLQSSAIRCDQMRSDAIRCNQDLQSSEIRCDQRSSNCSRFVAWCVHISQSDAISQVQSPTHLDGARSKYRYVLLPFPSARGELYLGHHRERLIVGRT